MVPILVIANFIFAVGICISTLWPANATSSGECQVCLLSCLTFVLNSTACEIVMFGPRCFQIRSNDADLDVIESIRFYLIDVIFLASISGMWHTIIVFSKKKKRRSATSHAVAPAANGPLAHHGASSIAAQNSTFEAIHVAHTATFSTQVAVDAVVSGAVHSLSEIRPLAPKLVEWLKLSLPKAHEDDAKHRVKALLGAPRFVLNLDHFGMWNDLIQHCEGKALEAGHGMKVCFADGDLATTLGEKAMPNVFGKVVQAAREGSSGAFPEPMVLQSCIRVECVKSQAALLQIPYPYKKAHSQLWNEKCFAHFLRMVAMGIDQLYQNEVKAVCTRSNGDFRSASIKGFVRMINKIMSKNDHYYEAWPR